MADKPAAPTEADKVDDLLAAAKVTSKRPQLIKAGPDSPFAGFEKTYTQQRLSFFGKLEFVRLVSKALDAAVSKSGDREGIKLTDLMGVDSMNELATADIFITAMLRLGEHSKTMLKDIYMISLNVPEHERIVVANILDEPYDEETGSGGLSDEDGIAITETFVAQNVRVMLDFYREKVPVLIKQVQEAMTPPDDQTPAPSKRSKRSARSTQ